MQVKKVALHVMHKLRRKVHKDNIRDEKLKTVTERCQSISCKGNRIIVDVCVYASAKSTRFESMSD